MNGKQENTFEQMESIHDTSKLKKDFNKDSLVGYVQHLRGRVEELQSYRLISKMVEMLERSHFKHLQYCRRESIEIHGIPDNVDDKNLESKSLEILGVIGVEKIEPGQVHACHRLKNKKNTIIRFVSRKTAESAL